MVIFGALAGIIAWAVRPKYTGVGAPGMQPPSITGYYESAGVPEGFRGPPLLPEEDCLLCLLTLWAKDKQFPPGRKRYFNRQLAVETAKRALKLGLRDTARAVLTDGPIPAGEKMGRRGVTVRDAIVIYNQSKKS